MHELRKPCKCGHVSGYIVEKGAQDVVRCVACDVWQYNAPRTETGKKPRTVQTVHAAIKPKQRQRILQMAGMGCQLCHKVGAQLHVSHIISVAIGLNYGIEECMLNDDENLIALCDECNLGMGDEPVPLRLAVAILRARITWKGMQGA